MATSSKQKKRISEILERLDAEYGTDLFCYLDYVEPYQLLI